MRVAIYVQHLLGTGHLVRTQALALALYQSGHEVLLISGGKISSEAPYACVQLPVLKTLPGDFLTLLDENLVAVSDAWKASRAELLQNTVFTFSPDVVVIETWPFGRRQMQFEILPLLHRLVKMTVMPMMVCSIRDVLQRRKQKRRIQTLAEVHEFIDLVLVHGEEELTPLQASFEEAAQLQCKIAYSGYVAGSKPVNATPKKVKTPTGEVVVSAGGGATGSELLNVAAQAAALDNRVWRLLVGPNVENRVFESLVMRQSQQLIVERNRSDFQSLLTGCAASVSQFGYNTALDLVVAGCPSVVIPYSEDGETEQTQRARCFEEKGYVVSLQKEKLTPESLLAAIQTATINNKTELSGRDLNGAKRSVEILETQYKNFRSVFA